MNMRRLPAARRSQGRRRRVADVFKAHWQEYDRNNRIAPHQRHAARHIVRCRTAELGGHLYRCEECGSEVPLYNSCLDRHCPTCQTVTKMEWLAHRQNELLPVQYFHAVFTLPHGINGLVDANRRVLLGELFGVSAWVLRHFAADPQWRLEGDMGFIAALHTWNQLLLEHFHLHCIVPGGVWREDSKTWIPCRRNFLFGKQALADAFRNRFLKRLVALRAQGKLSFTGRAAELADSRAWDHFLAGLKNQKWIVWPKPTAAGPEQALDYLGRYTHRVAISDSRILKFDNPSAGSGQAASVTFAWRDRADHNMLKTKTLPVEEFIRRFLYHILPPGFQKIRYFGWLASRNKARTIAAIRAALKVETRAPAPKHESPADRIKRLTGVDVTLCPFCDKGRLVYVAVIAPTNPRAPP